MEVVLCASSFCCGKDGLFSPTMQFLLPYLAKRNEIKWLNSERPEIPQKNADI